MKKLKNLFSLAVLTSIVSMPAFAEPDPNFHIYLMVGQSNMEGAAPIETQDRVTNSRVMVLQDESCPGLASYGQWRVAAPPLIRCNSGLGPGDYFGKTMADNSDQAVTIGLVGAAFGGQKIEYFLKNCGTYNACQPSFGSTPNNFNGGYQWLIDIARKAQEKGVIKGIIFHQGESNTGDPAWPGRVNQLVTDIRNDLGIGNVPFIAGELPYPACCASHNTLIAQLPSVVSNAHVVSAEGLNIHDQYHFDSPGVREMGRRYANKMLELVDTSASGGDGDNGSGANTIVVRLSGVVGDEAVNLQVGGTTVKAWTATSYMSDYTIKTDATGEIRVGFTNDSGDRDVQVDYIVVNGVVRQAEDQDDNTGVWGNDSCGGGSYSEWLHCNGSIGFGNVDGSSSGGGSSDGGSSGDGNTGGTPGVSANIEIGNDWGEGYCGTLVVTNNNSSAVTWEVSLQMDGDVNSLWNGTWSQSGLTLTVSGAGWNDVLQPGQTDSSVGLCVNRVDGGGDNGGDNGGGDNGGDNGGGDNGGDNGGGGYEVPANNFAVNGGVEDGLSNWGTTAGTLTRSTADKHSGSASAYITGRTSGWHGITFNVGKLTNGNQYDVAVWVKLAPGSADVPMILTAKRQDDSDSSTYNEYEHIATATASASQWTLLQGLYTQSGTPFEKFIVESDNDTVSYYVDDFSVGGEVSDDNGNGGGTNHDFFVGNITTNGSVRSDFVQYWDQITPENEGKWGSVERTRDVYNWSGVDAAYNYAKQHNIPFKQHTFVWGSQYPTWIDSLSPSEQAAEIEEWIRDFCTRYPDVDMIDVVNESTPGHAPAGYAQSAFGSNWIIKSFQLARQYCPNAILILNDYNVLSWNTDEFIAMATPAVNAGVVDAIGLQSHGLEDRSLSDIENKLNRVAALGLPIYISEYDVAKSNDQTQLSVMQSQFPLFYNHPSVKGITLWGYVVGSTWVNGSGLISSNGNPRPAMTWLMNYLGR
ncbi:endo-1,4-beta-xylanase [Gynuella sunshinyii]|uniref:endo-1,4-beta-xylanase n=1 Tax=Gynuella sunshinyii YC6258 TaxID=1445510 RepID=A0A0C5W0K8_9GAMM|nr:endo-1,4-beta-xylanase [Gynuella sunshinyii]AJQ96214.1 beta-1,4-xylanase [Gynuella sunshinyii YC6258]